MSFFSMCVNDYGVLKSGTFYSTTYTSNNGKDMVILKPLDLQGNSIASEGKRIYEEDFNENFYSLKHSGSVEIRTIVNPSLIERAFKIKNYYNNYLTFYLEDYTIPDYLEINKEVLLPLLKLTYTDEELAQEILTEFGEIIILTFNTLNEFYSNKDFTNYREGLKKAAKLTQEIYDFGYPLISNEMNKINKSKQKELDRVMDNYKSLVDSFNTDLRGLQSYERYRDK